MSLHEYIVSRELRGKPFYSLIMAAMFGADTHNLALLQRAFPETYAELDARYNTPGARLRSDLPESERCKRPSCDLPRWQDGYCEPCFDDVHGDDWSD